MDKELIAEVIEDLEKLRPKLHTLKVEAVGFDPVYKLWYLLDRAYEIHSELEEELQEWVK